MTREADEEHRDDKLVLDIIVDAIAAYHAQCDLATSISISSMLNAGRPLPPGCTMEFATMHVNLGILKETKAELASVIITALKNKGFAVGMFE